MLRVVSLVLVSVLAATSGCGSGTESTQSTDVGPSTATSSNGGSGAATSTSTGVNNGGGGAGANTSSTGGSSNGGSATGGAAMGGSATSNGGATAQGGNGGSAVGGSATGGSGGAATGGSGGAATGGSGGSGGSGVCTTPADCDDNIACTVDSCLNGVCENVTNNGLCDNGMFCDGQEICDPSVGDPTTGCFMPSVDPCDDGATCTTDSCDEASDTCQNTPTNSVCDNGTFCDGAETCDPANGDPVTGCVFPGTDPCDDGGPCTVDSCDEVADTCSNQPNNQLCDNAIFCDGAETCNVAGTCDAGTPPSCADTTSCTSDFCDVATDACANVPQDSLCSNGLFCDGLETCAPATGDPITGCLVGTTVNCNDSVTCTIDSCDEANDTCSNVTSNAACDDGQFCNGAETCDATADCQPGNAVVCADGLSCTADSCNETSDQCDFIPNDQACSDGLFCSGTETCNPAGPAPGTGCDGGTTVSCMDDGIACTVESCDEGQMGCITTPDNSLCPAGQFCVPALNGCVPSPPCATNAECDDADDCNGIETCNVVCQSGTPVDCNDGVACTVDSCNPVGGACTNAPSNAACDDGFVCSGTETCDANLGCQPGTAVDCDDGVACTSDSCNEPSGTCNNLPQQTACSDGLFCTGVETCDPVLGCQAGTPPSCDDSVACTADSCDAATDQCLSETDNSQCACGETCDSNTGCGNYCVVAECSGKVYECGNCLDDDADCTIDTGNDTECVGPCDNNEDGYKGEIPGQNSAPCKQDCYFDGDTGSGNDDCYWSHVCDPLSVAPNYPPEGQQCEYDPNTNIPGSGSSCSQLSQSQSATCGNVCGPLVPNGCDCFGCCEIPGAPTPVWLGSEDANGDPSCDEDSLADPNLCKPCTLVPSCFNTCDNCEICLGKPTLPPECLCQECLPNQQLCGDPCGTPCPFGEFCNSGCCTLTP